jgi:Leucine-rich repeat (LRR) protein
MKEMFKTFILVITVLSISSCTHKKSKIPETKDLDTVNCTETAVIEKPVIVIKDSIFNQLGIRVFKDSSLIISTKELKSNSIPDWVFEMKKLKNLTIDGMFPEYNHEDYGAYKLKRNCFRVDEIPPQIKNLTELKSLILPDNDLSSIPNELITLKNLKIIDLSNNPRLHNVTNLEKIVSLEFLSFYGCHLTNMPTNIGNLRHLKKLALDGNPINEKEKIRIKKALPNCNITF